MCGLTLIFQQKKLANRLECGSLPSMPKCLLKLVLVQISNYSREIVPGAAAGFKIQFFLAAVMKRRFLT